MRFSPPPRPHIPFVSEPFRLLQGRLSEAMWVGLDTDEQFFLWYHYSVIWRKQWEEKRQERSGAAGIEPGGGYDP